MKKLRSLQGGYPRQQDYLLTLQNELTTMADALFAKLGVDMVLQGCDVTNLGNGTVNITAGIVYVGGEVLRFDGANNVPANATKTFVKTTAVTTDPKVFANGSSQNVYSEVKVVVGDKTSTSEIPIKTTLYTLETYIQDVVSSYAIKGEIKDIYDVDDSFTANFDASGLGATPRYNGWAICNGNNGTPNLSGRVRIGVGVITNPDGTQVNYQHGANGGETMHQLTISEMPEHNHQYLKANAPRPGSGTANNLYEDTATVTNKTTSNVGGGQSHNNMQPYFAVFQIMKVV